MVWNFLCPATQGRTIFVSCLFLDHITGSNTIEQINYWVEKFCPEANLPRISARIYFIYCRCVQFKDFEFGRELWCTIANIQHSCPTRGLGPIIAVSNKCVHGERMVPFPASFFYRIPIDYDLLTVALMAYYLEIFELTNVIDSTTFIPKNMNNKNQFEKDKVIDLEHCHYYVDNSQLNSYPQLVYPNLSTTGKWEVITCNKMLDQMRSIAQLESYCMFLRG